jgi:4-coumarate--CoA ligase
MGYLDNPTASAETFKDGWFHTGDVGHIDKEGLFHIEDRIKEYVYRSRADNSPRLTLWLRMIKVKGTQVPPAELEDLLLGHELVDDCMVLGIPDNYAGERPKAYVVLKTSVSPSEEVGQALLQYVKSHKVRYKWVAEIEFVDTVPKSPSGKLLRRVMKTMDRRKDRERGLYVRDETERARL